MLTSIATRSAALVLVLACFGCQSTFDPDHSVHETIRRVAKSDGHDGLWGMTIAGAVTSRSDDTSVNLVPGEGADRFHVIITYQPWAELVHHDSDGPGETWVLTASSASVTPSKDEQGYVVVAFENATVFPGIQGVEKNHGYMGLQIPSLWYK